MAVLTMPESAIDAIDKHLRCVPGEQTEVLCVTAGQSRIVVAATPPLSAEQMQRVREALVGVTVAPSSFPPSDTHIKAGLADALPQRPAALRRDRDDITPQPWRRHG